MSWNILNQIRQRVREEEGVLRKPSSTRVALCYPSPYPVGMSSLGFQTIYREIHLHPGAGAERAFLPDNPEEYRKNHLPVLTYESEAPLSDFPAIAFSIAYELELPGILEMLDLSGIPLLRQDRTSKHPVIIAGGPLTNSNPVILAPFVDLIILGEGEELIHAFLDAFPGENRGKLLGQFSEVPGCFVPGTTRDLPPIAKVKEDRLPAYSQILTKDTVLASMFLIEPERRLFARLHVLCDAADHEWRHAAGGPGQSLFTDSGNCPARRPGGSRRLPIIPGLKNWSPGLSQADGK